MQEALWHPADAAAGARVLSSRASSEQQQRYGCRHSADVAAGTCILSNSGVEHCSICQCDVGRRTQVLSSAAKMPGVMCASTRCVSSCCATAAAAGGIMCAAVGNAIRSTLGDAWQKHASDASSCTTRGRFQQRMAAAAVAACSGSRQQEEQQNVVTAVGYSSCG